MEVFHIHHIIPKHMGGTDDPENLIKMTIEEHAEAHRILWKTYGKKQDYFAWKGLSGSISKKEIIKGLISFPGESNPFYDKKHTEETKAKMSEIKKGRIWVKRGTKQKLIPLIELEEHLISGWVRGRSRF